VRLAFRVLTVVIKLPALLVLNPVFLLFYKVFLLFYKCFYCFKRLGYTSGKLPFDGCTIAERERGVLLVSCLPMFEKSEPSVQEQNV